MAVLLTILKITGIVLLGLLGLILFVAAVVLFVPVRYKAYAEKNDPDADIKASFNVSWLLHIISAEFLYDDKTDKSARVFGIKIWPRKEKEEKEEIEVNEVVKPEVSADDFQIDWNEDGTETKSDKEETSEHDLAGSDLFTEEGSDNDLFDKIDILIEKLASKYDSLSARYEKIRKEMRFWKKYADDEQNKNAVSYIKKRGIKLIKKISPRKIKGFVHFGFDDPAVTGSILVVLSVLYPVLPKRLKIDPGFEDTDIYGDVTIKGNIMLITLASAFLGVYFNRDCRRMWRIYRKHKEKY